MARSLCFAIAALGIALTACGQSAPQGATPAAGASAPPQPAYHPSMGDLMTMAIQPRHAKLGLAGKARNWRYAAYELSELRHAFDRIARTIPSYRKTDIATMVAANIKGPLDDLDSAIKAGDGRGFDGAYTKVTAACNACHQGLGHDEVVIQVPGAPAFPDQDFRARARG